eukprot:2898697-Rhodomonas_salina.8
MPGQPPAPSMYVCCAMSGTDVASAAPSGDAWRSSHYGCARPEAPDNPSDANSGESGVDPKVLNRHFCISTYQVRPRSAALQVVVECARIWKGV